MIDLGVLIGLDILSVIVLGIILCFCIMSYRQSPPKPGPKYFILMIVLEIVFLAFNALQNDAERTILQTQSMSLEGRYIAVRGISNFAFFLLLIAYVFYAALIINDKSKLTKILSFGTLVICGGSALWCLLTVLFPSLSRGLYYIDFDGSHFTKAFLIAQTGLYFLVFIMLVLLIKNASKLDRISFLALISFITCPSIVSILRFFDFDLNLMAPATFVSFILMYCFLYIQKSKRVYEQDLQLANNRLAVLHNQIRPHFLYNTLNSIYVLCGKDPKAAQSAIGNFAEYMRANLESLEEDDVIPLDRELEHVDHYLSLEKMRFGGDLEVEYDTDYVDMMIPPMTVQIIAENAVKHGIEKKTNGFGKIIIRTRRTASSDLIIVEDNGVGFDVEAYNGDPSSHIGIVNAKERLRQLLGASLIIESELGSGTTVTIIIPRAKKDKKPKEKAEERGSEE